ncbi:MAG: VWA domain-containing protein [Candidatus Hydrogenedentes bacterium]|nr:VWA domain-containing protein [Candidatus Hydrogenedentota bacterium]
MVRQGFFLTYPYVLILILPAFLLFLWHLRYDRKASVIYSSTSFLRILRVDRFNWRKFLPPLFHFIAISMFVIAISGPTYGVRVSKDRANVVDIILCLDISGSMTQQDYVMGGRPRDRLYVAKMAAKKFVESRKISRTDRFGLDRIGLVLFAGIAWTRCPLTLDYEILERTIDEAIFAPQEKDGTAIGSALGLAVQRLSQSEAKSKVIILLTDGINNRGEITPMDSANIAKERGIKVYTIGAGSEETGYTMTTEGLLVMRQPIDEEQLKKIAEITGGKYYRATDTEGIMKAYDEISQLESTEVEISDFYEYKENFMPFLLIGFMFALAYIYGRRFLWDPLP